MEHTFKDRIKQCAFDLGFALCGVASAQDAMLADEIKRYKTWLSCGYGASMDYLKRHVETKSDPTLFLSDVKSIICVAQLYGRDEVHQPPSSDQGRVSIYALGSDYHQSLRAKLEVLATFIASLEKNISVKPFVDSHPVLDRFWSWRAGLGWIGKNTCLINRKAGSFLFLGGVMTSLSLMSDALHPDHCGKCTRCLDACPTQALIEPRTLNSNLCIAYHTIENKGVIPKNIADKMENWIGGCDICQAVCPWNDPVTKATEPLTIKNSVYGAPLQELAQWDENRYRDAVKHTAMSRVKYKAFLRNVAIALNNS